MYEVRHLGALRLERHSLSHGRQPRNQGAKKRVSASTGGTLQSLTKAELYKKATAASIPGCSTMTHDELADAPSRT